MCNGVQMTLFDNTVYYTHHLCYNQSHSTMDTCLSVLNGAMRDAIRNKIIGHIVNTMFIVSRVTAPVPLMLRGECD